MPSFFSLPRELRDKIYHHIFLLDPYLIGAFYKDQYYVPTHYTIRGGAVAGSAHISTPTWLLASKTLMREALAQYTLHASWVHDVSLYMELDSYRSHRLPLHAAAIKRLDLDAGFLPQWTVPSTCDSGDARSAVSWFVDMIKDVGRAFERVCVHAYVEKFDYVALGLGDNSPVNIGHAFGQMRRMFEGVEVGEWVLEVQSPARIWKMDLVFGFALGQLVVLADERRPEEKADAAGHWAAHILARRI